MQHMNIMDPSSILRAEAKEYRRLYLATFAVFLLAAMLGRLLPSHWSQQAGRVRRSILAEARETAHATLAFAFTH